MWMRTVCSLALFTITLQGSSAQEVFEVRVNCTFEMYPINEFFNYACILNGINFDFTNPFYYITAGGRHAEGQTNNDVRNFVMRGSNTNQIPANIFQVFPNVEAVEVIKSGIVGMSGPTWLFSNVLRAIFVSGNNIPALTGQPFGYDTAIGARVTHLNMYGNQIETISQNFFTGLTGLTYLVLSGNNLRELTPAQMAPMVNLRFFLASSNQLEILNGRFFERNTRLEVIGLEYNNLRALGPAFLEGLTSLEYLGLSGNECVDQYFEFDGQPNMDQTNEALQACFDNSIPDPPRSRILTFELRGKMAMANEYREDLLTVQGRRW